MSIAAQISEVAENINSFKSEHASRIADLEKRFARMPEGDNDNHAGGPSLGDIVAASSDVQRMNSNFRGQAVVKLSGERAALTTANTTQGVGRSQGTSLVPAQRLDTIVEPYRRQLTVRDLLSQARTTSNVIEWPFETSFTNNAAMVAEATAKPYSDVAFNMKNTQVRTLAHLFKASRQILDDAPSLIAYINRLGTYGIRRVEEDQLLNGNGTGQNLLGLIPQATAFAPTFVPTSAQGIDRIALSISQAEDADIPVTGIVMNKRDWRRITTTKDAGGNYLIGNPQGVIAQTLWGLPVATTNSMPVGKFLTGAYQDGAQIFDRMDIEVLISTENADDFEKNLVSIRIEERLAFATFRPDAFIFGDVWPA